MFMASPSSFSLSGLLLLLWVENPWYAITITSCLSLLLSSGYGVIVFIARLVVFGSEHWGENKVNSRELLCLCSHKQFRNIVIKKAHDLRYGEGTLGHGMFITLHDGNHGKKKKLFELSPFNTVFTWKEKKKKKKNRCKGFDVKK